MAIFFLLLGLYGIIQSLTFRYWESMVLPLTVSSLIFIIAAVEVGRELHRKPKPETTIQIKSHKENGVELRRLCLILGWAAAFMFSIYLLGFIIAIPLFTFSYLKWRRRSWLTAIVFCIVMTFLVYGIFTLGLRVPLFKGVIFSG